MNVLFLHRWTGVHEGGTETNVKNSVLFLAGRGHQVTLVTCHGDALPAQITNHPRVKVYCLRLSPGESKFSYSSMYDPRLYFYTGVYALRLLLKVGWLIFNKKINPNVMSVHFSTEALVAFVIRQIFKIPFAFVLEGYTPMEARIAKHANLQFCCSRDIADKCQENFRYLPTVRIHGVDTVRFTPTGRNFKKEYFDEGDFIVAAVCRLEPRKNITTLIYAAQVTSKKEDQIKYLIVGEGVRGEELRQMVSELGLGEVVKFAGRVSEKDLPVYYRTGDIYVLPTLYEGFGIVYAEAMASGLPIVSTTAGAVPEVVGEAGILLEPKDVEGFAQAILRLYRDPTERERLRQRGFKLVRDRFDMEKVMGIYEQGLKGIVDGNSKSEYRPRPIRRRSGCFEAGGNTKQIINTNNQNPKQF